MDKSLPKLFAALAICTTILVAQQAPPQKPAKVVFVCEHGAAKSIIAKAELEWLAREKGLFVQVEGYEKACVPMGPIRAPPNR